MKSMARFMVRLAAWLAPAVQRARFREEWLAEVDRAGRERPLRTLWRALGAPVDAVALRWHENGANRQTPAGWHKSGATLGPLHGLPADTRFALRLLRKHTGFTAAAWITLALGIGATTAMYVVVYSVLLRPLPVEDEDSLAMAYVTQPGIAGNSAVSYPKYLDWKAGGAFRDLAAFTPSNETIDADAGAERVSVAGVSPNFFDVVGVRPQLGRALGPADANRTGDATAVVSDGFWRSRLAADPEALGRSIDIGDLSVTVVGVLPPGFHRWPRSRDAQVWVPIDRVESADVLESRGYWLMYPVGRLHPGMSLAMTQSRLDEIDRGTAERSAPYNDDVAGVQLVSVRDDLLPDRVSRVLVILLAAVGLTWLVVCANLSNLLLARASGRTTELAIRRAVGASRARLLRQLALESATLAIPGGVLGILAAFWIVPVAARFIPSSFLGEGVIWIDTPVLLFAVALTAASTLLFGLLPAARASGASLQVASRERVGMGARGTLQVLLAAEVAVGIVVLVGAVLLVRSVAQIRSVDLGFDEAEIVTLQVRLPLDVYGAASTLADPRYRLSQRRVLDAIRGLPGVEDATLGDRIFTPGIDRPSTIWLDDGRSFLNGVADDRPNAPTIRHIGPEFFAMHRASVVRGRELTARDLGGGTPSVLINEAMADTLWPGEDAVGRRVNFRGPLRTSDTFEQPWAEVVGIVRDIRHAGVDLPARPTIYRSVFDYSRSGFDVIVRSAAPNATVIDAAHRALRAVEPGILIYEARRLEDDVADAHADVSYSSAALSMFAILTTILAAFGVYSVLAYAVSQRRREIGVRMALGAAPGHIAGDIGRQLTRVLLPGIAVGVVAAAWSARALGALLYGVAPTDPIALAGSALAVTLIAVGAAVAPARAAARIDPVDALRD